MFRKVNMVLLADMIWTCGHQLLFHVIFGYFLFTFGCFCLHLCVRTNHNNLNQLFPFRRLECIYRPAVLINNTATTFFSQNSEFVRWSSAFHHMLVLVWKPQTKQMHCRIIVTANMKCSGPSVCQSACLCSCVSVCLCVCVHYS